MQPTTHQGGGGYCDQDNGGTMVRLTPSLKSPTMQLPGQVSVSIYTFLSFQFTSGVTLLPSPHSIYSPARDFVYVPLTYS